METIKSNILNQISGEHKSVYDFAKHLLGGFENTEDKTPESKLANSLFNAILRFADSRLDIDRNLGEMARIIKSEQSRLQNGSALDIGWINPAKFEAAVEESKKLWHEVHTLTYIIGLTADEINKLADKIHSLTEYRN